MANDDYIQQDLVRGGSSREPSRTCSSCGGRGNTTEMRQTGTNSKGKPEFRNETVSCKSCGGRGTR